MILDSLPVAFLQSIVTVFSRGGLWMILLVLCSLAPQMRGEDTVTNSGRKSVDAVETPLAKYIKQVNAAIGSNWSKCMSDPKRLQAFSHGTAKVSFFIDTDGRVGGIRLVSNSSNASFAEFCTSAVHDAREQIIELKFPDDPTIPLKDGRFEHSLTFTYYK